MRKINHIVVHCTATMPSAKVSSIVNYWKKTLRWKRPGYHYIISVDGVVTQLLEERLVSNGVKGHNYDSIHLSYIGGVDASGNPKDTRTVKQKKAMLNLLKQVKTKYPKAEILGHKDFAGVRKACPSFDAKKEYKWL